jgi:hypothetical protein
MSKPERRRVFRFCAAADHLGASMAALNKGLAAAELPEEPSLFLSRAEHDAAIEALRESREGREGEILLDPRSKRSNALR